MVNKRSAIVQGRDAGGGGRDVAGGQGRGGGAGGQPDAGGGGGGGVPGGVRRDDVLPAAEPVPGVPVRAGHLRAGAPHGQRLPHRAVPGPGRGPAAHEGRPLGGRQAPPGRAHRQHRRSVSGNSATIASARHRCILRALRAPVLTRQRAEAELTMLIRDISCADYMSALNFSWIGLP
jgi:hypothetical protein